MTQYCELGTTLFVLPMPLGSEGRRRSQNAPRELRFVAARENNEPAVARLDVRQVEEDDQWPVCIRETASIIHSHVTDGRSERGRHSAVGTLAQTDTRTNPQLDYYWRHQN